MKIKFCCKAPNLKLTKKLALIVSGVLAAILVAGIVLCAVLGFNSSIKDRAKDYKSLSVSLDYYSYEVDGGKIKGAINEVLGVAGLEADDVIIGNKGVAGKEIVYMFDKDTSNETLQMVKNAVDFMIEEGFEDAIFSVSVEDVNVVGMMAKNYVARGLIALAIFAVASILYVWIRYKLFAALYMLGSNLLTMGLTTAIIALTRVPVLPSVAAAIAASVLFSAVATLMFFNKLRAAQKEDDAADKSAEEIVTSSIAWKETTIFAGLMTAALLVMICVGRHAIAWFSLSSMIGVHVAAFISLVYVPVMFVPAKKLADKIAAEKAKTYKGAKKGEHAKKAEEIAE